jgi:hypothetical protein
MPTLLGRVLRALGREEQAVAQLERGADAEERAGLVRSAEETRAILI